MQGRGQATTELEYVVTDGSVQPFDMGGSTVRWGVTDAGTPYAVAADIAKVFGYAQTKNALGAVSDDEKGFAETETPSGRQRMSIIYEDGIWELIFRSTLPAAAAIKDRVKAILREIRETGRYEAPTEKPMSELEMARRYVAALERNAELEPKAEMADAYLSAGNAIGMMEVAKLLGIGRNTLYAFLRGQKVLMSGGKNHNLPYQEHAHHFKVVGQTYERRDEVVATSTTYVTPEGVEFIRRRWNESNVRAIGQ